MANLEAHASRIVELSWDRTHEELTAIVLAESSEGLVIREVVDLCEQAGRRWIRRNEIVDLDDLAADHPARRIAELRGTLAGDPDMAPSDLASVLQSLAGTRAIVGIHTRRTGTAEMLVGVVERARGDELVLAEVDPSGSITGDQLSFELDEIIGVDWATDYLTALGELVGEEHAVTTR